MDYIVQISKEEAKEYTEKGKAEMRYVYTFRTEPILYEQDFLNRSIRYFITQYMTKGGKVIPTEVTQFRGYFFHGLAASKSFIYEHLDEMDWVDISKNVKLRENFMREFADHLDWKFICKYQKLKKPFILEMKKYIKKYMKNIEW